MHPVSLIKTQGFPEKLDSPWILWNISLTVSAIYIIRINKNVCLYRGYESWSIYGYAFMEIKWTTGEFKKQDIIHGTCC